MVIRVDGNSDADVYLCFAPMVDQKKGPLGGWPGGGGAPVVVVVVYVDGGGGGGRGGACWEYAW